MPTHTTNPKRWAWPKPLDRPAKPGHRWHQPVIYRPATVKRQETK